MNKNQIPFFSCDNCVWWQNHNLLPWKKFMEAFKIQFPKSYESMIKSEKIYFSGSENFRDSYPSPGDELKQQKGQWFKPTFSKCPFDFKPNLKIALRRKYKLHCFGCGNKFNCPAEVYRDKFIRFVTCGECLADMDYPYYEGEEY